MPDGPRQDAFGRDGATDTRAAVASLVGYWQFEDGPGSDQARDSSGHGRHGSLRGLNRTTAWTGGRLGGGLLWPVGAVEAGVEIPADPVIDGLRRFTITAWFNRSVVTPDKHRSVISRQLGTSNAEVFNITCDGLDLIVYIPGTGSQVNYEVRAPNVAVANEWIHVATTYDGSTLRLYARGMMVGEKPFADRLVSTSTPLFIGTNKNASNSEPFEGILDEVALFDSVLPTSSIQALAGGATVFQLP